MFFSYDNSTSEQRPARAACDVISTAFNEDQCAHSSSYCLIGSILWGHNGPLCHALSLLLLLWTSILHCHSPGVATVARRLRYSYSWLWLILVVVSTVTTPGEWQ